MPTYSAHTTLSGVGPATALSEAMERIEPAPTGIGVVEIEDGSGLWEVAAYFEAAPSDTDLALLAAAFDAKPFSVSELPEVDWVAKVRRELAPVEAGRFFVYGSHDSDKVPEGKIALMIEAAMAFGTGHHGTTRGCLLALDALDQGGFVGRNVADIGCGTAVLAMAAAAIWPNPVLASDIDAVAVEVAQANVAVNGLEGRVLCVEAAGFEHPRLAEAAPFDLVFANILMGPLIALAPSMAEHVATDGRVILSGLLNTQADSVINAYLEVGFVLETRKMLGEWTTLTLKRGK